LPPTHYDAKARPRSKHKLRDRIARTQLEQLWAENYSVYGRRKLTSDAKRKGLCVPRDRVARLMRRQGTRGASRAKRRFTTHQNKSHVRAPDLVKRACCDESEFWSRRCVHPSGGRGGPCHGCQNKAAMACTP